MQIISLINNQDNLNLDYHKKRLILKALNKHKKHKLAASELGTSERNLWMQRALLNINYSEILKIYFI